MPIDVNFVEVFMLLFLTETDTDLFEAALLALKTVAGLRYQNMMVVEMDSHAKIREPQTWYSSGFTSCMAWNDVL